MAESRLQSFTQFARDFFLYSTYFPLYLNERDSFHPNVFIDHTKTVVFEVSKALTETMKESIFQDTDDIVLMCDEDFHRFFVPKCLKILVPNYHVSLVAVMSFLHEFLLYLQMNRLCFRFHFTAYKCLVAVFRRGYEERWDAEGGWAGLHNHVKERIMFIRPREEDFPPRKSKRKIELYDALDLAIMTCEVAEDIALSRPELALIAEDNPSGVGDDPEDKDPLEINLRPDREVMLKKIRHADHDQDLYTPMPISTMIPVPYFSEFKFPFIPLDDDGKMLIGEENYLQTDCFGSASSSSSKPEEGRDLKAGSSRDDFISSSKPEEGRDPKAGSSKDYSISSSKPEDGSLSSNKEKNLKAGSSKSDDSVSQSKHENRSSSYKAPSYSESYPDPGIGDDYVKFYEAVFETRFFDDIEMYTAVMMKEARARYGTEEFTKKLMQRRCEHCGMKCYQFSYNLLKKQLDLANEIA